MENNIQGFEEYIRLNDDNQNTIRLKISGVHCAVCIQKIETVLDDFDGIIQRRLNFTTGALSITWDGSDTNANDYVSAISNLGYGVHPYKDGDKESDDQNRFLLMCLGVAGFAAGNLMLLSFGLWITDQNTMGNATREFLHSVSALIATPAILFAGRPFFKSAWSALKHKRTNMDVPISLALLLATGMSVHELMRGAQHVYFDSALMLCFFLLIGRYLDFRARTNARSAATDLMSTLSGFATIIENKKTRKIPIVDVKPGMIVTIAMGEKIPVDGVIETGETDIDTSLVTGETMPYTLKKGDDVFAGTLNISAPITVKVTKVTGDSLLADIVRLMEQAEQGQAAYTRLADRAANFYTPMVHTLAIVAFVLWFLIIGVVWQDALMIAVTVLIITCPCALGLAVPVAQVLSTGQLLRQKIMVKSGDALERLAKIDTIFFDKTGTLTNGKPTLIGKYNDGDLQLAASMATHSRHPLSQSIVKLYHGNLLKIIDLKEVLGRGLKGTLDGKIILLGNQKLLSDYGVHLDSQSDLMSFFLYQEGRNPVLFHFEDSLRDDTQTVLSHLKNKGMGLILLSGDRNSVVKKVAKNLSFDRIYGDLNPTHKYKILETMKKDNHQILMVGDGLNDAPVLAGADVSMAPGTAIDMAQNATDIIFMGNDLKPVEIAHAMAIKTQKIIKQNFTIALVYNMIAIPMAFMGIVTPMIAAIAMSGSSILVILNSFRLRLHT
jgi:Cu2+-exporting ATPase